MNDIVNKCCSRCKKIKPATEFRKRAKTKTGLDCWCNECARKYAINHYYQNRERLLIQNKKWRQKHKEKLKIYDRARKYGLTSEEYKKLFQKQNGKCVICNLEFSDKSRSTTPVVDHDHMTGEVRALLCFRCNTVVGMIETFPQLNIVFKYLGLPIAVEGELSEVYKK